MAMKVRDLTGEKFGDLTVVKRADDYVSPKGKHYLRWLCSCICGNTCTVIGEALKSGGTKSCGCLKNANIGKANKKYNTYDLTGEYGIGYTIKGEVFYFDLEDYNKIKDYCWYKTNYGYIASTVRENNDAEVLFIHRLIMGLPEKTYEIDHIHGKFSRNDNRKSNLRVVTKSQNMINVGLKSNNTSSVAGVSWNKSKRKWEASISINHNRIYLGSHDKFEDAVKVRKEAEEKYFGEYSYNNSVNM